MRPFFCFLLLLVTPMYSYSAQLVCSGKVENLSYHSPNILMLQLSGMNKTIYFCNPEANWTVSGTTYTTGPETCKTMYSTFLAVMLSGKTLHNVYFDGDEVPQSCNQWGSWKRANIRHFNIRD